MTARTRAAAATLLLLTITAATSCAPAQGEPVAPSFALTSAEVVYPTGQAYPVNLIFAAAKDDPIWTDLTGIDLPGGAAVGPGDFEVIRGEGSDGFDLGNVAFNIIPTADGIAFETVGLIYADTKDPIRVDVGSWAFMAVAADQFATRDAGAEVVAMSGCTSADFPVPASTASLESFSTGSSDVQADEVQLHPESASVTVALSCSDDVDFHIFSPTLEYTDREGAARSTRLAPVTIGFQDIDAADLRKIRER
ncbi:hypothetical protein KZC51_03900 [Microbacterium sp. SSW1-49]|uniref:Lipoprotein n=1 Tax=Microbacterium croceum TaxID=2851645 RepID=A0ABT0FB30_9MICO|nr:hypothetical protein [Microbacterium croceum]MCK2035271.1 hypothetical protein [Microbacterium croceum]